MKTSQGSSPFTLDVTHHLIVPDNGGKGCPLIVLLHGMGQTAEVFAKKTAETLSTEGRVLLIPDGPLPLELTVKGTRREGRAWYIYTGDQESFLASLEETETHLLQLITDTLKNTGADPQRVWLVGFSQGGYAAGVIALKNMDRFAGVISASSRIKTEILKARTVPTTAPAFIALHGNKDRAVLPNAAEESIEQLKALGFDASFESFDTGHRLDETMLKRMDELLPDDQAIG